jgi:hypothetical protein
MPKKEDGITFRVLLGKGEDAVRIVPRTDSKPTSTISLVEPFIMFAPKVFACAGLDLHSEKNAAPVAKQCIRRARSVRPDIVASD